MKGIKFIRDSEELADPLLLPLYNDIVDCEDLLSKSDTQFARRAFVRASFAFIGGYIYWLKGAVIEWLSNPKLEKNFININITAIALLQDAVYRPNKQGKVEEEPNRLPFLNYCAFVLRTAAEYGGMDAGKMFSDNGWKELQDALKVRDRITHLKQPQDLEIVNTELDSVRESLRWLLNCVIGIVNAAIGMAAKDGKRDAAINAKGFQQA